MGWVRILRDLVHNWMRKEEERRDVLQEAGRLQNLVLDLVRNLERARNGCLWEQLRRAEGCMARRREVLRALLGLVGKRSSARALLALTEHTHSQLKTKDGCSLVAGDPSVVEK